MTTADAILAAWDAGLLARGELVSRLIDLAAHTAPASYVDALPPELIAELRARSASPPATADELIVLRGGTYARDVSAEAWDAEWRRAREQTFAAVWNLHRHFHAGD